MARSPNCTGAPTYRGRVDVTITYPGPDETPLETPVVLPTSEPAEAQISYTLASGHMPVWSPFELEHIKCAAMFFCVRNASSADASLYWRTLLNGVSVSTGSSTLYKNYMVTRSMYCFRDVVAGDVLSCKLWSSVVDCSFDYSGIAVFPSRIGPRNEMVADVVLTTTPYFTLQGTYPGMLNATMQVRHLTMFALVSDKPYSGELLLPKPPYALVCAYHGDIWAPYEAASGWAISATRPDNMRGYVPSRIAYTPLNLRV